ncbi:piggyBac transposable element-derived protein 4-like [Xiphophorus hellerii]|uniref:piggyBac transposable element-derived protein 4-like n=1 Tax=Xiphophorus hellerii TaxID=8084 RepID=UPI0013B37D87|nr:piggyBac transposable element-derived protein 4-like [Xiphophorus hellerii]
MAKRTQKPMNAEEALELLMQNSKPWDSEGEDIDEEVIDKEDLDAQPDSDSELSSDEETLPLPKKRARSGSEPTETTKDGTVWRQEQVGTHLHFTPIEPYAKDGEPSAKASQSIRSRLQSFLCFITLEMLRTIQQWTTQHARQEQQVWFMDLPELMAFISVIILRGVTKVPSLCDSWSANLGNPRIIATMARNRFQNIMRHLRFDDMFTRRERAETNRFAAISDLWESFAANCISSYSPGRHITVDEQLFPTKTRCCFLQYIATKPDKFGIKFWVACDLKSQYICNVFPYLGKDPSRPSGERLSETVVMRLMEPFMDKGRTVTTDNFFTSLSLAQQLRSRKTTILGSVNKRSREIPQSAKRKDRTEFTTQVFSTSDATLTVYVPKRKKVVYILSSMHSVVETEDTTRRKPNTIKQYNKAKCGVDVMDQMVREYSVRAGTRRWPVAVFYNMIDMAALNAHVLYQACTGVQERRVDFLVELAKELANSHVSEKNACKEQLLCQQPATPSPGKRAKCQINRRCIKNSTNRRCVDCFKYACGKCSKPMNWQCQMCADSADSAQNEG